MTNSHLLRSNPLDKLGAGLPSCSGQSMEPPKCGNGWFLQYGCMQQGRMPFLYEHANKPFLLEPSSNHTSSQQALQMAR